MVFTISTSGWMPSVSDGAEMDEEGWAGDAGVLLEGSCPRDATVVGAEDAAGAAVACARQPRKLWLVHCCSRGMNNAELGVACPRVARLA